MLDSCSMWMRKISRVPTCGPHVYVFWAIPKNGKSGILTFFLNEEDIGRDLMNIIPKKDKNKEFDVLSDQYCTGFLFSETASWGIIY